MEAIQSNTRKPSSNTRYARRSSSLTFSLLSISTIGILSWAWTVRDYHYMRAESGLGYMLGITGASLMVVLLLYPLRKRWRKMRGLLQVKSWFRLHMVLGVLGPLCILLHSNFQLGSTNSTVALSAMLLVAGSGFIGRYLYSKFHFGLYGNQVRLEQLKQDLDHYYQKIDITLLSEPQLAALHRLHQGTTEIINNQKQQVSLRQLLRQRNWLRKMKRFALKPEIANGERHSADAKQAMRKHMRALSGLMDRLAGLRLFERLFWLWHVVHIPVFILMLITATVHIFVVHWY